PDVDACAVCVRKAHVHEACCSPVTDRRLISIGETQNMHPAVERVRDQPARRVLQDEPRRLPKTRTVGAAPEQAVARYPQIRYWPVVKEGTRRGVIVQHMAPH